MFSQIFIDRPKLAIVISLMLLLAGALCVNNLPIAEYPEIAPPQIHVQATYAGASASVVADTVALPLEAQINGLENLLYFSSTCDNSGLYECTITFKPGTNPDMDLVNTQNAIKRAEPLLPQDVQRVGVQCQKRTGDILAMFSFTTDGSVMSNAELNNYAGTYIKDFISRVDGVSDVNVLGAQTYAMRIWIDPIRLAGLGLSTDDIARAVNAQNIQAAAGTLGSEGSNGYQQFKINVKGRLKTPEEFGAIVLRHDAGGNVLHLRDIAKVELGQATYDAFAWKDGRLCVGMMIFRNSDANAVATVKRARAELDRLSKDFPKGVTYEVQYDPTEFIAATMKEIVTTLVTALLLVVLITFIFLQDWRATLIPTMAIPVALMATFPVMKMIDYSINTLTLFGLILVIGSLVDDAIVVVENCQAQLEHGNTVDPKKAASDSMKQITGAIIATTLVTLACYVPLAFYGGMVGAIYKQFSVTMCVALCFSTFVAMTLSPAMCAMILRKPKGESERGGLWRPVNWGLNLFRRFYLVFVRVLVHNAWLTILILGTILAGIYYVGRTIPSSFLPTEDKGAIMCDIELPPASALSRTTKSIQQFRELVEKVPGVDSTLTVAGYGFLGGMGENCGLAIIKLAMWDERTTPDLNVQTILGKVQALGASIPDAKVTCFLPPAINGLGMTGGLTYEVCVEGDADPQKLSQVAMQHAGQVCALPEALYGMSTYNANTPQIYVDVDHEKAESLGLTSSRIYSTLQSQLASYYINDFNILGDTFYVKMQSERNFRATLDDIRDLMIANDTNEIVPLSSVATTRFEMGPRRIQRFNKMTSAQFNDQAKPGIPSGVLMKKVEALPLPPNHHIEWTGMSLQEKQNEGRIGFLMGLAILFAYLFLVAQYESWTTPVPVMLTVSTAVLGALYGMKLWGESLSIYAQLGLIMLIGLTAKNAILMVEFSKKERESGKDVYEAAQNGASLRYRAVLMTAWSFVFGVLPLVFSAGAGAGSRRAIGITTFSGMIAATMLGIVLTPGLYAVVQRIREAFMRKPKAAAGTDGKR